MRAVHERNADRLAAIIAEHGGWPGLDLVGAEAAQAAWLVVQHAISRPALMRSVLTMLTDEIGVPRWQAAQLEDRIRVYEGRKQRFGTSFDWDEAGQVNPHPIEDPGRVDVLRAEAGLPPLAEAVAEQRSRARSEPKAFRSRGTAGRGRSIRARSRLARGMTRRCIVVGGGIAGLSAGIAMRQAGYEVTVFEQAPQLEPIGSAHLDLGQRDGRARLARLRRCPARTGGSRAKAASHADRRPDPVRPGRHLGRRRLAPAALDPAGSPARTPGRQTCRLGVRIDDVEQRNDRVIARVGGEAVVEADLAVVADGVHSAIATRLLGNAPLYRGYGAVIGVGHSPGDDLEAGLAQEIWADRERFGLLDAGNGQRYWFYMAPFDRPDGVAAIEHAAIAARAARWPEALRAAVARTPADSLIRIPIRSRPMPRAMGRGRVICIGDAAHAMEPNQGQGGCQAIEDAWLLGALAQRLTPEALLAEFQARRLPRIRGYWRDSAIIGRAAHAPSRFERRVLRTVLALAPNRLDRHQIRGRHRSPGYGAA